MAAQAQHRSLAVVWLASLSAVELAAGGVAKAAVEVERDQAAHTSHLAVGCTQNLKSAAAFVGFALTVTTKIETGDDASSEGG